MQKGNVAVPFLLTILVVFVGGYYLFNHFSPKTVLPIFQKVQIETEKTYRNQTLGFEFKHNKDLNAKEDSEQDFDKRGGGDFRKNFKGYVFYEPGKFVGGVVVLEKDNSYDKNPFTVWIFDNQDYLTIDKWYDKYWYYPFVWGDFTYTGKFNLAPKDEATVSGQLGKSSVIDYQPGKPKFIYISAAGKMYLFRIIGSEGDKILSTFKFLSTNKSSEDKKNCKASGCSGEICIEENENMVTTCIYKAEYACYKNSRCEKQVDGKCGWTKTEELTKCLQEKRNNPSNGLQ